MPPKKMRLEGVSATPGEYRYDEPGFLAENITVKEWRPSSDTALGDHVIKMKLVTEPNEIIRFATIYIRPLVWPANCSRPQVRRRLLRDPVQGQVHQSQLRRRRSHGRE